MSAGRKGWKVVLVFIFCCHAIGILLFCKGFMLKRVVVPEYSECRANEATTSTPTTPTPESSSCSPYPRPFKRVLWLLIDALRYDFMVFDETLSAPPPVYRNKMPYVRDLLDTQPANARLFKFIADPPTTTMQRLKALTTGSLPTFVDFGSNFNSYAISEDSLPRQAHSNGRNVTFIGDDTWLGLYPDMFSKVFPYPSLNVKDLDTVDNGVKEHLGPEMLEGDAELVIGHMLGVDHVGHTYGPSHWTMGKKLIQMNNFIEHIFTNFLDEDTLVFVLGDHGMSPTGDHGGETALETDAALLIYSHRPLFNPSEPSLGREVYQIDLVPTIALALGLPIPFSNLGRVISEVVLPFTETDRNEETTTNNGYGGRASLEFLTVLRINAEQIHNYLVTYAQYSGDFPPDDFISLQNSYGNTLKSHQEILETVDDGRKPSKEDLTRVAEEYVAYMEEVRRMCHSIWAKFDNVPIAQGLFLLTLTIVVSPIILLDVDRAILSLHSSVLFGLKAGLVITVISILFTGISVSLLSVLVNFAFVSLVLTLFIFLWWFRDVIVKSLIYLRHSLLYFPLRINYLQLLALMVVVLHAASMFSNSFILYEADMLVFFIQSLTLCFAVRALKEASEIRPVTAFSLLKSVVPHVILMVCVRLSKVFYACRDLQLQDGCEPTSFILALASATDSLGSLAKWRFIASIVAILLIPMAFIIHLRRRESHVSLSRRLVVAYELGFLLCGLSVSIHWWIQSLPQSTLVSMPHWQHLLPPWIVYTTAIAIVCICILHPFKGHVQTLLYSEDLNSLIEAGSEANLPSSIGGSDSHYETYGITRQRKPPPSQDQASGSLNAPADSSSFGAATKELVIIIFTIMLITIWIPIAMLLNDGIALSAALTCIEIIFTVRLLQNSEKSISWETCVLWGLLSCHSFFGFGHHATVTSLRFEAAFTGIHGEITNYNLPLAGMLVGLNTLGSQILFGFGFPLLLILLKNRHAGSSLSDQILLPVVSYIVIYSLKLLMTTMAASLHRRHLMVWWVFAPRFLYESAFQMTTDMSMILSVAFVSRLEHLIHH